MSSKTETIMRVGIITMMLASLINVITTPFFHNVSAFPLQGTFDKLFGGLFHKPPSKQTQAQQERQQQNTNNSSISTSPSKSVSSLTYLLSVI